MIEFKIENFCNDHHLEFKKYYDYLNNPYYISILLHCLTYINHEKVKLKIYDMIKKNKKYIFERIDMINIIISFYKKNNLINKSEIGIFFKFYENEFKKINKNNDKDLLKLFYKLIYYPKFISVLKECFYIFSDYRACIYYMTPSINFYNTDKKNVDSVIKNFKNNLNTLNQIVSKIYIYDENPWGVYYNTAYSMFETLLILNKYYKDPLKKLNIIFTVKSISKDVIKDLCNSYNANKITNEKYINEQYINSVSQFIIILKKLGYDMWFVIPLVFDSIFKKYKLTHIMTPIIIGNEKIYYQKMNNKLGIMCYILTMYGYITNIHIFNNFND